MMTKYLTAAVTLISMVQIGFVYSRTNNVSSYL